MLHSNGLDPFFTVTGCFSPIPIQTPGCFSPIPVQTPDCFSPIPIQTPGCFSPIPFQSGRFRPDFRCGSISAQFWWVVPAHFIFYSFSR